MEAKPMTIEEAIQEVMSKPLIDLWPTTAILLDLSRSGVYSAAARGEIDTMDLGRLRKAISAPLRRKLELDAKQAKRAALGATRLSSMGTSKSG